MDTGCLLRVLRFSGLAAVVCAWTVILLSVYYNPWFVFTRDAFSDLGGPRAERASLYNLGLVVTSIMVLLYSVSLLSDATGKVETVGGAFMLVAGLFLALIGVYPSGTSPHTFVSTCFFAQADLAVATYGLGVLLAGRRTSGITSLAIAVVGPLLAAGIDWPSVATVEAYGIALLDAWVIIASTLGRTSTTRAVS